MGSQDLLSEAAETLEAPIFPGAGPAGIDTRTHLLPRGKAFAGVYAKVVENGEKAAGSGHMQRDVEVSADPLQGLDQLAGFIGTEGNTGIQQAFAIRVDETAAEHEVVGIRLPESGEAQWTGLKGLGLLHG